MRPVGVVKIEALDCILAIILWVSDSCNEGRFIVRISILLLMFTCGGSLHLDDAVRLFVHFPTVEGATPHRHFYARHLEIKIKFRICTHICKIRNRILNSIDQNCIQNFPECGWWFAFSAWFKRKCICFSIYFWVCSGPSSFHHLPATAKYTSSHRSIVVMWILILNCVKIVFAN